jgi:hypothetical protein
MQSFDFFPKASSSTLRRTREGAMLSLLAVGVALALFVVETVRFREIQIRERLDIVDAGVEQDGTAEISFKVDFFAIACENVHFLSQTRGVDQPHEMGQETSKLALGSEGCSTSGTITVPRATGDLHVALNPHVLNPFQTGVTYDDYKHFNASHRVVLFQVDKDSGSLDGTTRVLTEPGATASYLYDLHVVPMSYRTLGNVSTSSQHIRVDEHAILTRSEQEAGFAVQRLGLPGVYFSYKFSPLTIVKWEETVPVAEYLANLFALLGGLATTVAIIDTAVHESLLKHKLD